MSYIETVFCYMYMYIILITSLQVFTACYKEFSWAHPTLISYLSIVQIVATMYHMRILAQRINQSDFVDTSMSSNHNDNREDSQSDLFHIWICPLQVFEFVVAKTLYIRLQAG